MYTTLIKHEALQMGRPLLVAAGVWAVAFALSIGLTLLDLTVVSEFAGGLAVVLAVGVAVGVGVYLLVSYYRTTAGRVAYLTMSIPVRGRVLYAAKATWAFVLLLVSMVVAMFATVVAVGALAEASGGDFGDVWSRFASAFGSTAATVAMAAVVVIATALLIAEFAFYVTWGNRAEFHRFGAGGPVLVGLVGYVAMQFVTLAAILLIPLGVDVGTPGLSLVHESFLSQFGSNAAEPVIPVGFVPAYVILLAVLVLGTIRSLERRTSLR